jgi:D-aminopeptidase
MKTFIKIFSLVTICFMALPVISQQQRPRAREIGIQIGILPTGSLNAITDVEGVRVGHTTIVQGNDIRTGVTVILPHAGNLESTKLVAGWNPSATVSR